MTYEPLRNDRGRIRCYWWHEGDRPCSEWAVTLHREPTNHSVLEVVPICAVHAGLVDAAVKGENDAT